MREPEAWEAGGRAVHREHCRARADRAAGGRGDGLGRRWRAAVRSKRRTPTSRDRARSPSERRAGWTVAEVRRTAPPRKPACAACADLFGRAGRTSSGTPSAAQASTHRRTSAELRLARRDVDRRRGAVPRVDVARLAPLSDPATRALGGTARPRALARRRLGRAGSAGRPRASRRSRRSVRSARARRDLPRARPRRSRARAPSAARPSRGRGSRRRRRRRPPSCHPRAAGRLDRPGLLEPPAVARVPHPFHHARA